MVDGIDTLGEGGGPLFRVAARLGAGPRSRRRRAWLTALLAIGALIGAGTAPAGAAIVWARCGDTNQFACGHLAVPLDRRGVVPGTIQLALRRRRAAVGDAADAVVALAGGPGQAAIPFAADFAAELGPALATRDLIVLDQRGTGLSHALNCRALAHANPVSPSSRAVTACAQEVGPGRGDYTTADSVADIEAVRQVGGYQRLVLFGTSYGTKVALDYARAYPDHVESLVLDSTVLPDGPDVLSRSTFEAVDRVVRAMCAGRACRGISGGALTNLFALAARLHRRSAVGTVFDPRGRAHRVSVSENDLIDILVAGDLDPSMRTEFPGAVRSALDGDPAPMARLRLRETEEASAPAGISSALFYSTLCEELPYPWSRTADPATRVREVQAAARALSPLTFAPFTVSTALYTSGALQCDAWPFATPGPEAAGGPLPDVPTLLLSGAADLRTPTADARRVAAQIPDAKLVVVPDTGHSVLDSELGSCAKDALIAFFTQRPIRPCHQSSLAPLLAPTPVAPRKLSDLSPYSRISGRPGRTATAVLRTLRDLNAELVAQLATVNSLNGLLNLGVGGLRGGWARLSPTNGARLHRFSFVPGVTISGSYQSHDDVLRIGGTAAAPGTLRATPDGALAGDLGGQHVRMRRADAGPNLATLISQNLG